MLAEMQFCDTRLVRMALMHWHSWKCSVISSACAWALLLCNLRPVLGT